MKKPKVGDKLFLTESHYGKTTACDCEVIKVGRKFFTIKLLNRKIQFSIKTWRENTIYTSNYALYESRQQYLDKKEKKLIYMKLRKEFESGMFGIDDKYSLEQLKEVVKILGIDVSIKDRK